MCYIVALLIFGALQACAVGTYSANAAISCKLCEPGRFASNTGLSGCIQCRATSLPSKVVLFVTGAISAIAPFAGQTACLDCPNAASALDVASCACNIG